jgi:glycine dehydrogenase subunit 2
MLLDEPLIFEKSAPGRCGWPIVATGDDEAPPLPPGLRRTDLEGFPEVSELDVVRHFTRLSQWNLSAATTLYPLGSCTMKYNPLLNEGLVRLPGFSRIHPLAPATAVQGALRLVAELGHALAEISGLEAVSLQPAAGAQGELVGLLMIRSYHADHGGRRRRVLIPASAHGTNPASSALCGYDAVEIPVGPRGLLEARTVRDLMTDDVAALMVTNPNTLGCFEEEIVEVAEVVHSRGGLVYMDGANLNALLGVAKPGAMGVDVMQVNLHKTFSTPHGGGGPGAGPVAVGRLLEPYLPVPRIVERDGRLEWSEDFPRSIGQVRSFYASFGVLVRAYAYILSMGGEGLAWVTRLAVLNANYLRARLGAAYEIATPTPSMHECVFSDRRLAGSGVRTLDVAKRLLDHGFYAPTIYFPLVVSGALMIEPTETESRETLDAFAEALLAIAREAADDPETVTSAPHRTRVARLDETRAARHPELAWHPGGVRAGEQSS